MTLCTPDPHRTRTAIGLHRGGIYIRRPGQNLTRVTIHRGSWMWSRFGGNTSASESSRTPLWATLVPQLVAGILAQAYNQYRSPCTWTTQPAELSTGLSRSEERRVGRAGGFR